MLRRHHPNRHMSVDGARNTVETVGELDGEDYTWEKEKDVVGTGSQAGANELVDAYWQRVRHLESRRVLVDEQTAEPLTDEEIALIAKLG